MTNQNRRYGVAVLSCVSLLVLGESPARGGGAFSGETIVHLGDGGHEAWLLGSQDIGYKYEYVAFLWLDLWSWDGTYCVYKPFEHKYKPISAAEAARLLKKSEGQLETPFWYRYPPGLIFLGPFFLIGAIARVRQALADPSAEAAKLLQDPLYREAWEIAAGRGPDPAPDGRATFQAGVSHLVAGGVERTAAEKNLALLVRTAVTCPGCGLRHPAGTPACGCGRPLSVPAAGG